MMIWIQLKLTIIAIFAPTKRGRNELLEGGGKLHSVFQKLELDRPRTTWRRRRECSLNFGHQFSRRNHHKPLLGRHSNAILPTGLKKSSTNSLWSQLAFCALAHTHTHRCTYVRTYVCLSVCLSVYHACCSANEYTGHSSQCTWDTVESSSSSLYSSRNVHSVI